MKIAKINHRQYTDGDGFAKISSREKYVILSIPVSRHEVIDKML